jgi:hypothetical protein
VASATYVELPKTLSRGRNDLAGTDPRYGLEWRGTYHTSANTYVDFNDGVARVATIAAATWNSPNELAQVVKTAMLAVSTLIEVYWRSDGTERYRFEIARSAGTLSLQTLTGVNTASNILTLLMGFRNQDRAAAATHTGDFAAGHDYLSLTHDHGLDAGNSADCAFIANPGLSPGASIQIRAGATTAVSSVTIVAANAFDNQVIYIPFAESLNYRYSQLRIYDPWQTERARSSIGLWYYGPAWDSDLAGTTGPANYPSTSYERTYVPRSERATGRDGHVFLAEVEPGDTFRVAFDSDAGLGPEGQPGLEHLLAALGKESLCWVALDPDNEPHRESALCRVVTSPVFERIATQSQRGRFHVALEFERVV